MVRWEPVSTKRWKSILHSSTAGSLLVLLAASCSRGGATPHEPPAPDLAMPMDAALAVDFASQSGLDLGAQDLAWSGGDLATAADLAGAGKDMATLADLSAPLDLTPVADLTPAADLSFPSAQDVNIYVDNRCNMDVVPKVFNVPRGTFLKLTYYNRSRDYPVDVWMSYGGGFTDLPTGGSWPERFEHCRNPRPYSSYADISTACSRYRLMINCL